MTKSESEDDAALWPGVLYCTGIAVFSYATWFFYKPISSLMWAFLFSIAITNVVHIPKKILPGISFVSNEMLRGTIAVLGIVTSALIWVKVGAGLINALVVIFFSLIFSFWLGRKMNVGRKLAVLIGAGVSICGASAIAALAPALKCKDEEACLAIAGITIFGLVSMVLYPFLFTNTIVGQLLNNNLNAYAVWVGSGVHETAQVIAAAGTLGAEVVSPAMLVKSVRIFMIGPVVLIATYILNRSEEKTARNSKSNFQVPVFGIMFIVNSIACTFLDMYALQIKTMGFDWLPIKSTLSGAVLPFLLAMTFVGVGSKVRFASMAKLGIRPLVISALTSALAGSLALVLTIVVLPFISPVI